MKLSRNDVLNVAVLAHLHLTEAEVKTYLHQLDSILTYMDKLNELHTTNVDPLAQPLFNAALDEQAALREDRAVPGNLWEEVSRGTPDPASPYFRVPRVIDR